MTISSITTIIMMMSFTSIGNRISSSSTNSISITSSKLPIVAFEGRKILFLRPTCLLKIVQDCHLLSYH